ncbi:MAG: hypothetical protein V9E94_10635 [Microthrixaceae bacterium]
MSVQELLQTVQYVTDREGKKQAVLLGIDVWEELINQLHLTDEELLPDEDDDAEWQQAMIREEIAYRQLHPTLYPKYEGRNVAILEGQLVDYDTDSVALYQRIRQKYPGKFVLMTPVRAEAVESYQVITGWFVDESETANPGV